MIKISAVSGTISMFQTGTGNAGSVSGTGWPIGAITVGTEPTKTLVINMYSRRFETGGNHDAMTMQTPGESIEIGQMVTSVPSQNPHYMWSGWSYDYQAVSSEIPEQEISYTITRNNNQCITQRLRFKAT
jgi:hypothetical protein